ncbi:MULTISPECIES: hypothetical protein [unclassified Xanthobacter]|uniref:hypothetical protein n=1 Tax=unclassified Xanthobacter TaxID=2623496 RepID=UPI001F309FEA|nr:MULTISPECIES: hypothetical protein [unclassified Xanthobacter]
MKVLPTARILIVDSQVERREALRNSLIAFGVGGVQEAGSLEAAAGSMATGQPDVLIVHADNPDQIPENPYRDGNGAPAVLVAEAPTQALMRAAARGGYDAAVGAPAAPPLSSHRLCHAACPSGGAWRRGVRSGFRRSDFRRCRPCGCGALELT